MTDTTHIRNARWLSDEHGPYWAAELWQGEQQIGMTGSYYGAGDDGQRASRDEQIDTARSRGWELGISGVQAGESL